MGREKLLVEIKAEELIAEIDRLLGKIPYECHASKHLEKSGNSTFFNIGEAVVCFKPREKIKAYNIARREAGEVQKALRALVIQKRLKEEDILVAYDLADHIVAMLTNMIKNLEERL